MKRLTIWMAAAVFLLAVGAKHAVAQDTFKVPFPLQVGELKLSRGDYSITKNDNTSITIHQVSTGKEFQVPFIKRLDQPNPPHAEPELVIDAVGNFAPSYTDYVTDYLLAEVWLDGKEGFLIHVVKGAHSTQTIKGEHSK